ncbi:gamma-glutamyl-gamma-aminobutyrate hydrolase [bacterium DOLZORAL124_64_63]|nr:MAG: gamma-glutamyl-gamma-aminobutyrate hydrolase [bacterium DOLZORAL124_64_63]
MRARVWLTQRVEVIADRDERRDALDRRWIAFVDACGAVAVPVPNDAAWVETMWAEDPPAAVLLTGGNSLVSCGGDAPERDAVENLLLDLCARDGVPVLGVCRGMQVIMARHGARLVPVTGHVAPRQTIDIAGVPATVNSYHDFGAHEVPAGLEAWARARDGVIKAVRVPGASVVGIMWHPERMDPFRRQDRELLRELLGNGETT